METEDCLEMTVNYIVLQLYLWTHMFMQNNQMKRYCEYKTSLFRVSKFSALLQLFKYFLV